MPRSAISDPNLFSMFSKRTPQTRATEEEGVSDADKAARSAFYQIAQNLLYAGVLAGVFFVGDSASLAPKLKLKKRFLQLIETSLNFAVEIGRHGCRFR